MNLHPTLTLPNPVLNGEHAEIAAMSSAHIMATIARSAERTFDATFDTEVATYSGRHMSNHDNCLWSHGIDLSHGRTMEERADYPATLAAWHAINDSLAQSTRYMHAND
jgi:hypothetical protein